LLLDAVRGLRAGLYRLDRRQGVLVRRDDRRAALVAVDRRLRLRLAGRVEQAHPRRLVQRALLLAGRGHRRHPVAVPGERADLGLRNRPGRARLFLDPEGPDVRARPPHRQAGVELPRREVLAARRRAGAGLPGRLHEAVRPRPARCPVESPPDDDARPAASTTLRRSCALAAATATARAALGGEPGSTAVAGGSRGDPAFSPAGTMSADPRSDRIRDLDAEQEVDFGQYWRKIA